MSVPPRDQVETVLADVIREHLENKESTHVPGLGTFMVRHRNSTMERSESGTIMMQPPCDEIVFTADE